MILRSRCGRSFAVLIMADDKKIIFSMVGVSKSFSPQKKY